MRNAAIKKIIEIGKLNKKIVFLSVDQSTGNDIELKKVLKERFIIEPISEANVIGMASGLSAEGYIPLIFNHATFNSRRCYEQILLDSSLQNFPIKLISNGAGFATSHLGPTHTSIDDVSLMRQIPNMNILVPSNAEEVSTLIPQVININKSFYVRLSKFGIPKFGLMPEKKFNLKSLVGKARIIHKNHKKLINDILIISNGVMTPIAIQVSDNLKTKIKISVLDMTTVKPLDGKNLISNVKKSKNILICEEHSIIGGLGSACIEYLIDKYPKYNIKNIYRVGVPDKFILKHGDQEGVLNYLKLDARSIEKKIFNIV